jgi:hypothetical protein
MAAVVGVAGASRRLLERFVHGAGIDAWPLADRFE